MTGKLPNQRKEITQCSLGLLLTAFEEPGQKWMMGNNDKSSFDLETIIISGNNYACDDFTLYLNGME